MTLLPRPWLEQIHPYGPGLHASTADGSMASNESPLGASPHVTQALAKAAALVHRYPDPLANTLRSELARLHRVDPEQILIGNGSDELIFLLAWAYLAQGGHAVTADPAYRIDEISSQVVNARVTKVPLANWTHDLESMASCQADIAYVVNPHNPTGTVVSRTVIERFVATCRAKLVVIDEAYIDFTEAPEDATAMSLTGAANVVVLRTFSKIHGLAGLRVGYLVAAPSIVATLCKIRAPFSVGSLAQAGALAALADPAHRSRIRDHTLRCRGELTQLLTQAGYSVVPSQANFVLVVADEEELMTRLARRGITARPGSTLGLPGTVRISIPSMQGMAQLAAALSTDSADLPATSAVTSTSQS